MSYKQERRGASRQLGEALQDLLDRARQGVNDLMGLLNPTSRPAMQPVPVRNPQGRAKRQPGSR